MFIDVKASTRKPNIVTAELGEGVADVRDDPRMLQSVDISGLPFAAKTYNISPNIRDYVLVNTPICPSDIPNRNGIAFPLAELTRFQPPPMARIAYKGWIGCPVHYEHANEIHTDAYGIILDASLQKIVGYGNGKLWKVMGLLAIDKTKYPKMAERVLNNEVNTYSMGAWADWFTCSYCETEMKGDYPACSHVDPRNTIDWREYSDHDGSKHIAFRNAHSISPIEVSIVENPAWTTALSDQILGVLK